LNTSGPEGEDVLGNSAVDQFPKSNDLDAKQSLVAEVLESSKKRRPLL
jgi:hypothetical protein